jgi:hypothetical protein
MSSIKSGTIASQRPGPFVFLRDPLYLVGALIIALYLGLLYYVLLLRGVMTPAIHARFGIPVSVAPFPWANVWETPATYIGVLDKAGRPGSLIFGLAILMLIIASLLTGIFVSGVLYSKYRGFGAAGTACAAGGSVLVAAGAGCPTCLIPATAALGIVIPLVSLPLAGVEFLIVDVLISIGLLAWFARRVRKFSSPM